MIREPWPTRTTHDRARDAPRPCLTREVEQYGDDMRRRLLVAPGLTGLWQVSGRSDLSRDDAVEFDVRYVENRSIGVDLSILLRTARGARQLRGLLTHLARRLSRLTQI